MLESEARTIVEAYDAAAHQYAHGFQVRNGAGDQTLKALAAAKQIALEALVDALWPGFRPKLDDAVADRHRFKTPTTPVCFHDLPLPLPPGLEPDPDPDEEVLDILEQRGAPEALVDATSRRLWAVAMLAVLRDHGFDVVKTEEDDR